MQTYKKFLKNNNLSDNTNSVKNFISDLKNQSQNTNSQSLTIGNPQSTMPQSQSINGYGVFQYQDYERYGGENFEDTFSETQFMQDVQETISNLFNGASIFDQDVDIDVTLNIDLSTSQLQEMNADIADLKYNFNIKGQVLINFDCSEEYADRVYQIQISNNNGRTQIPINVGN